MAMRSELGKVRGLGAAKGGTHHWWMQRVTAIANVPLGLWLIVSLALGVAGDHFAFTTWVSQPLVAVLLILFAINIFYHIALGAQVAIEDYLHAPGAKFTLLIAVNLACVACAVACIFAVAKLSLGTTGF